MSLLSLDFMQRALLAALLTGLAAPAVGTYLVQRRLALMGDGLGHVALTGVALGLLTGWAPVWTAVVAAILGATAIELIRTHGPGIGGRCPGDALLRWDRGRCAARGTRGQRAATLNTYLFGSITTVSASDLWVSSLSAQPSW